MPSEENVAERALHCVKICISPFFHKVMRALIGFFAMVEYVNIRKCYYAVFGLKHLHTYWSHLSLEADELLHTHTH